MMNSYGRNDGALHDLPIIENIQESIESLFDFYTNKHNKVLVIRFDVRYPNSDGICVTSKNISNFIAYLVKKYKRKGYDPYYIWVKEQNTSSHPHYHFTLFLNGNKVKYGYQFLAVIEDIWGRTINCDESGLIFYCDDFMLRRNEANYDQKVYDASFCVSYLAKEHGKNHEGNTRNFGMSRLQNPKKKDG